MKLKTLSRRLKQMNLDEALKNMKAWRLAEYFKWKHEIRYDQTIKKKTEEEFLKSVDRKTLNSFTSWERSAEYKKLLILLLESKLADDMEEIYNIVTKNAKKGDDKSVRLFLSLQKEIMDNAKTARESFKLEEIKEDKGASDDLILD